MLTPVGRGLVILAATLTSAACSRTVLETGNGTPAPVRSAVTRARAAFVYVERPDPRSKVRTIPSTVDAIGIDENSAVDIQVDEDSLRQVAVGLIPGAKPLGVATRLDELRRAVASLDSITSGLRSLDEIQDPTAYAKHFAPIADMANDALTALASASADRLRAQGVPSDQLIAAQNQYLDRATHGTGKVQGFQWDTVAVLLRDEMGYLHETLAQRLDTLGVTMGIHASLLRNGAEVPVSVAGYDTISTGPAVRNRKVAFAVSKEEEAAFNAYDSLAQQIRASNDVRGTLAAALLKKTEEQAPQITALIQAAGKLRDTVGVVSRAMASLNSSSPALSSALRQLGVQEQARARALVDTLRQVGVSMAETLAPVQAVSTLRAPGAGFSAVDAMNQILGALHSFNLDDLRSFQDSAWIELRTRLEAAVQGAGQDAAGAVNNALGDLPTHALDAVAGAQQVVDDVKAAVLFLQQSKATQAVNGPLPLPPGLKNRALSADLDTSFDLETIAGGRAPGERLRVMYELRRGDQVLLHWDDNFTIESYGLSGSTVASLAFVQREGTSKYVPTPLVTWTLRYRSWPRSNETGTGWRPWHDLGLGVSTTTLDFSDSETTEVGLAVGASLGDLLFGGYGANLQVSERRTFWFFSLRLLRIPGILGGLK